MAKKQRKNPSRNRFREILILALVLVLGFALYQLYGRLDSYLKAQEVLNQEESEKLALEKEQQENQRLLIQSDSESLMEKLAREQLGMVKPGETVYRLSPSLTPTQEAPPPSEENFLWKIYNALSQFFSSLFR